jgi:hypothetical protein
MCCRCRKYSLSLTVSRVLDVGSIAEGGRVVDSPAGDVDSKRGLDSVLCRMLQGWVVPLLRILLG